MSEPDVGVLESIDAFQRGSTVYLVGAGVNPSTGWKNGFERMLGGDVDWVFVQYAPEGIVLPVLVRFVVKQVITGEAGVKSLSVRYREVGGSVINKNIPVRQVLTPSDQAVVLQCNPGRVFPAGDSCIKEAAAQAKGKGARAFAFAGKGTLFRRAIGSLDNPLDCCDVFPWPHCHGSSTTWYLEVRTPSEQDIAGAVEQCLQMAAIAAALAAIGAALATGGAMLSAAIDVFLAVLKPCLIGKLGDAVDIRIDSSYSCN